MYIIVFQQQDRAYLVNFVSAGNILLNNTPSYTFSSLLYQAEVMLTFANQTILPKPSKILYHQWLNCDQPFFRKAQCQCAHPPVRDKQSHELADELFR